ncbi:hypothetical protein Tco_0074394, partial [Tanacetum coccineum]
MRPTAPSVPLKLK